MVSLRATTLFLSLISSSLAQNLNGLCSGSVSTTNFTDSCGGQWTVYCNADASPSSYGTINNVASFGECMSLCSNDNAQNRCDTVTYTGTTCYLKRGFRNIVRPSNANSATVFYPVPAYPAPVTNGVARSSGCGQPLNSQIVAGGASTQFSATGADGYVRTYNVHVPSTYDPSKAAPLIMAFHGRGDSGSAMESNSGLSIERINPYGISVYPTAIKDQDQQNTWQGDPSYATNRTVDDIGFVRALVTNISAQYCVDTSRVFAAGMSNGGGFVNVLACDPVMSSVFNAFAPHSGAFYTSTGDSNTVCFPNTVLTNDLVHTTCSPSRRVPMIEFHGDADGTIGYFGGGRRGYCLPAIPHWTQDWAIRNNLTSDNVTTVTNGGNLTRYEFGAASGYPGLVTHFRLAGVSSVVSSPSSSLTGSSTTSAATGIVSQASYSCPANDRQQVVDSNGFIYTIGCNSDSTGGGTLTGSARSFNDCFGYCDQTAGCNGFTYNGNCYLKLNFNNIAFQSATDGRMAAIRQHCSIRGKFTVECFFKLTFQSFQSVVECFIGFVVFLQSHIDGFEFIIKFGVKFLVSSIIELIIFVHRWLFLRKFAVEFCIKPVIECLVSFKFFVKSGLEFVVVVHTWLFFSKLPIEFCFEFVIKCLFGSVIYLEFLVIERECFVEPGLEFLVSRWFVFGKFTIKCCLELIFKCLISPFLYFKLISECFLESGISLIVDHRLFIVKLAFKHIFQFCFGPVFERFFGSVICHQLIILIFEPCIIVVKRCTNL
ncbi:hypothetical protein D6C91_01209 [Aureobasidium pullulans]|uniref:feruloyl esterase n=1 Tax=Aureobasidium pullulans TaxID=5580 RepID=A0A4S9U0J9_AURPU|nr:hypothetical protein D6C91_01209 [Aureobasidium pullulans]